MIKLIVKLAIAALIANAIYRVGSEYITFIKFRDDIRADATYRAKTDDDLRLRIVALAAEYDVPLGSQDVAISRKDGLVSVKAAYKKPIEIVPQYPMEWPFEIALEVQISTTPPLAGAPGRR